MDELKEIKLKNYQYLNEVAIKGETLFTGSSLMELFPICEIARSRGVDDIIYNRGISGLNTDEFLQHIHPTFGSATEQSKVLSISVPMT